MTLEEALDKIDELERELEHKEQEFEEYKEYVKDNYKRISVRDQIGE